MTGPTRTALKSRWPWARLRPAGEGIKELFSSMNKSVLTNNLDEEKLRASEEVVDDLAEMEQIIDIEEIEMEDESRALCSLS